MTGAQLILKERKRQIEKRGYDAAHDAHNNGSGQLAVAAACYAAHGTGAQCIDLRNYDAWPWEPNKRGHQPRIAELAKAGALIAAEIDRLLQKGEQPRLNGVARPGGTR